MPARLHSYVPALVHADNCSSLSGQPELQLTAAGRLQAGCRAGLPCLSAPDYDFEASRMSLELNLLDAAAKAFSLWLRLWLNRGTVPCRLTDKAFLLDRRSTLDSLLSRGC